MNLRLTGGLSKEELDKFHEKVLYLIKNSGIEVPNEIVLKRLSDHKGVHIKENLVTFDADLVNKYVFNIEFDLPDYFNKSKFLIITGNMNPTIKDSHSGEIRFANSKDLKKATKLEDSYDITGSASVRPNDIPQHLQEIFMYKVLWENSKYKGNDIFEHNPKSTIPCCEYIYEMAKVVDKRFTVGLWIESPKMLNKKELEIVNNFLDKNIPMWVGNFPIYGVSTPIFIESGLAQATAELFSAYLVLKLLNENNQVYLQLIDSIMGHPFDWKYGTLVLSSVEDIIKTIYQVSLNNYYNIPVVGMTLLSCGKETDCQQGFEKGVHTLIAALSGVRAFRAPGYLATDSPYYPEQLVIDMEMVEFIEKIMNRKDFDFNKILMDKVINIKPGGNFFGDEITAAHHKEEYWDPVLFNHMSLDTWRKNGSQPLTVKAKEIIESRVKNHNYKIDEGKQRELDKIYSKALNDKGLIKSYKNGI